MKYLFLILFSGFVITSCRIRQPYQSPNISTDKLYRDLSSADTVSIAEHQWRDFFNDTTLQGLIEDGIARNPDLQIAFSRIKQARSYYLQSRAAFLPSVDANASVTRNKVADSQSLGLGDNTQYQLGLSSAWEADIWGKLNSGRRASLASFLQTESAARAVQTSLVANIAIFYYSLMALDEQLIITEQTVMNWDTTVSSMRLLKEAARVTEAAVVQSEAQRYAAEVTIPDLRQSIRETENALSILLGSPPASIPRNTLQEQDTVTAMQTGVPAQLLANRPDVLEAELNFRYFFELTNVARSFFYPSLTINGSAGLSALSLTDLFEPGSLAASIGAGLAEPIFNRRANKTRLEVARAQQEEALINFQNTLLIAGREVSDAMSLYQTAGEKMSIRRNQMTALRSSVDYSHELLRNGFANYTEVITARQSLLQAELGSVNDRLQRLQASVDLYRALGGGWK